MAKSLNEVLTEAVDNNFEVPESGTDRESKVPETEGGDASAAAATEGGQEQAGGEAGSVEGAPGDAQAGEGDRQASGGDRQGTEAEGDDFAFAEDEEWRSRLKEETRERFDKLLEGRKADKAKLEELGMQLQEAKQFRQAAEQWQQIQEHGNLAPEDIQFMVEVNRALKSPNPQDRQRGYEAIKGLYENIAPQFGDPTGNFDPLSQFPDLQQRVATYQISQVDAREIARSRIREGMAQRSQQQSTQQSQQQQMVRQIVDQASQAVISYEQNLMKSDPDYKAKQPHMVAAMRSLVQNRVDPRTWPQLMQEEYQRISDVMSAKAAETVSRTPNPMRPSGSNATQHKVEAKNMNDALTNALAEMRSAG